MTGQQLVNAAMNLLGALTQGESPSVSESTDALQAANDMLASWSIERMNIFTILRSEHPLVTATQSYTIGSAGVFNVTRPVKYERAAILIANAGGSGKLSQPLDLIDEKQWSDIVERGVSGVIPRVMYADMAFPLTTLYLWPVPTFTGTAPQLELWTWQQLQSFADLTTAYTFPPGYDRALKFNLAVEVAPQFGIVPTPQVQQIAAESKAALRMLNMAAPGATPVTGQVSALAPPPGVQ